MVQPPDHHVLQRRINLKVPPPVGENTNHGYFVERHVKVSDYNKNYLITPTFSHVIHHVFWGWVMVEKNTK